MKKINIDLETFSSINLQKSGVFKYCESNDFEILLFAYSIDNGKVIVVDLANGEMIPHEILESLTDDAVEKWAFNAMFERICLSKYLGLSVGIYLNPSSWRCTMIWSALLGLPLSLAGVGAVLGLDKQKLSEGRNLIRYFCVPCLPTKSNGGRTRNLSVHASDKWQFFKFYNARDVETEMLIQDKLSHFPVSDDIWHEYQLDQEINDRGIGLDDVFVTSAIHLDTLSKTSIFSKLVNLTGLENPNSVLQMRRWLLEHGLEIESLGKQQVIALINSNSGLLKEVLLLRQQIAKSSVKKYQAMENAVCKDSRAHGMFQYYGANRTGRFSGRLIQLHNLPQNHISDLAEARSLVRDKNFDALVLLYESTPKILSELIRTAFVPQDDKKFIVADFSAIEARMISWLAGEEWRLEVFKSGGDIYCASASQMFNVPVEKNGVNGHLRQKGKISELALGYGGSVGALTAMGALDMGLTEEELQPLVTRWRKTNPRITKLWWDIDKAVKNSVRQRTVTNSHGIKFNCKSGMLFVTLLSGRELAYVKPQISPNKFNGESVTYEGVGLTKKWERLESYGPKFVENIVQAMARDILCFAMANLRHYRIVGHVHDEVILEVDKTESVDNICDLMSVTPPWAKGLLLNADGYACTFYQKE
ncbi:DNA polymerase [Pseudolactococcus yaeyamensis]